MSELSSRIIRAALDRCRTGEDRHRLQRMLDAAPPELMNSPGAVWDLVQRMEILLDFKETIATAGREAQQRIHHDLPGRINDAAMIALRKIRDSMPRDVDHSARQLYQTMAAGTLVFGLVACIFGWVLGVEWAQSERAATHAATDREFGRCVDAAAGAFATSHRSGPRAAPVSSDTVRNDLMICGAEYADRRAEVG